VIFLPVYRRRSAFHEGREKVPFALLLALAYLAVPDSLFSSRFTWPPKEGAVALLGLP
jgi:hypothetical protein